VGIGGGGGGGRGAEWDSEGSEEGCCVLRREEG
jgi:hypothetical protein